MQRARTLAVSFLASLVLMAAVPAASAFQLNALVSPVTDKAEADYSSVHVAYIEYPQGGEVKSILENVNDEVRFSADKDTPGVSELIDKINSALVSESKSPAQVADIELHYKAVLKGTGDRSILETSLKVSLLLTNFVVQPGAYDQPALIDLNWRGFRVTEPVPIQTEEYGEININFPSGYMYARQPEVMSILENTDAVRIFNSPLLDYSEFSDLKLDEWHWLFNPIASQPEGAAFEFELPEGAKALTVYSAGESSLREGIHEIKTEREDVTINGAAYTVRSTSPQSSGTMDVLGWAQTSITEEGEGAFVYSEPPEGGAGQAATGGFPFMVLLVLGGLMAVVAGFVLWRANKK